jgi:hypothetical protein
MMDFANMNYEDVLDIFDPIDETIKVENIKRGFCHCGSKQDVYDCFYVCPDCGIMDLEPLFYDIPFDMVHLKRSFYKRRLYCIEKLNYIGGLKQPTSIRYRNMVAFLKTKQFTKIEKLKRLMKKYGYNKYYKYIYSVYFDIKKIRLIKLTAMDIHKISLEFVKMDVKFTKYQENHKRKNFMAYNSIIYLILQQKKFKGFKHILKPNNHNDLTENVYMKYLSPDVV